MTHTAMRRLAHSAAAGLSAAVVAIATGCRDPAGPPAPVDRVEGWRGDLQVLIAEVPRVHPPPSGDPSFTGFRAAITALSAAVPNLSDEEVGTGIQRILADVGDAHTSIIPDDVGALALQALMVDFYWFDDGVYIVSVRPGLGALQGARVTAIGGMPVDEFRARLAPFVPRDNDMSARWLGAQLMQYTAIVRATGATSIDAATPLAVVTASAGTQDVSVGSHASAALPRLHPPGGVGPLTPRYLRHLDKAYWVDSLTADATLYVNFSAVRDDAAETLSAFAARVGSILQTGTFTSVVLDVRLNNGGNNLLLPPLQAVLKAFDDAASSHRLFAITGRATFSAGQNFVNWMERNTRAVFVGEATGSRPNFLGDVTLTHLPYSNLQVSIASRVYQDSDPGDARPWIAPDIPVPVLSSDYFQNRDPAFDAVMAAIRAPANARTRTPINPRYEER